MNKFLAGAALALSLAASSASAQLEIYSTSFEAPTYTAGNSLNGVGGWAATGTATVRANGSPINAAAGTQYVELSSGAVIDKTFGSETDNKQRLWVEGYFRGAGSDTTLANATYPATAASAIVHFSQANGIEFLNGNGSGGGTPVSSTVAINSANWYKISILLNFSTSPKRWDAWVNNTQRGTNLGFRNSTITKLAGFKNLAQGTAYFDAFRVVEPLRGDANGDSKVDGADVTTIVQQIASPGTDVIVRLNGDMNNDFSLTTADATSLTQRLVAAN